MLQNCIISEAKQTCMFRNGAKSNLSFFNVRKLSLSAYNVFGIWFAFYLGTAQKQEKVLVSRMTFSYFGKNYVQGWNNIIIYFHNNNYYYLFN